MEEVEPVHGQAFFTLGVDEVFSQILVFDYYDPGDTITAYSRMRTAIGGRWIGSS